MVDEYENPVSNREVTFVVLEPAAGARIFHSRTKECDTAFPLWGDCDATAGPKTALTSHKGTYMHTILGKEDDYNYNFKVSSQINGIEKFVIFTHYARWVPGSDEDEPARCLILTYIYLADEWGRSILGAAVGTKMKGPLKAILYMIVDENNNNDNEAVRVDDGEVEFIPEIPYVPPGQVFPIPGEKVLASVTPTENIGNGEYVTEVTVNKEPGANCIEILGKRGEYSTPFDRYFGVYGVKIDGLKITPQPLLVDGNGQSQADLKIPFEILPPEYFAYESQLDRYKGSSIDRSYPAAKGGTGVFTFVKGASFDIESLYSVQVVLNRGSMAEIKSEKKEVKLVIVPNVVEVFDENNPCNKAPAEPGIGIPIELENMLILATDLSNNASINIHIEPTPPLDTGKYILWKLTGDSASPSEGDFSIGSDVLIVLTPDSTSVYNFQLEVGIDSNGNGLLDSGDYIKYAPTIKTITEINYEANRVYLYGVATGGDLAEFKLSSSFLLTFLGKGAEVDDDYKPTITGATILPEQRFSHNAGAEFDESVSICNATVKEYIYDRDSQASEDVGSSDEVKEEVKDRILLKEASDIKALYEKDPNMEQYQHYFEISEIISFGGTTDLHYSLGDAPVNFSVTADTIKKDGQIYVEDAVITGNIKDLYDFNYFSGEKLAQPAATMQFGWTAKLGSAGNVFQDIIKIERIIHYDFCLD